MSYSEIIRRLEGASGPDRELDRDIMLAIGGAWEVSPTHYYGPNEKSWSFGEHEHESNAWNGPLPYVTASLDASLALVGERLGGKIGPVELSIAGSAQCCIQSNDPCGRSVQAFGNTPPLAVLVALFRALSTRTPAEQRV